MKTVELVRFCGEMLKRLHESGIRIDDYKYLGLYEEYVAMRKKNEKMTYCVAYLSDKYGLCERKVYKVISHFETTAENVQYDSV